MTRTTRAITGAVLTALALASAYIWRQRSTVRRNTATSAAPKATSATEGMAGKSGVSGSSAQSGGNTMSGMAGMTTSGDGSVLLTASQLRQFGVTFGTVEKRLMSDESRASGTVVADQTRMSMITARYNGYVEKLMANVEGQRIAAGQAQRQQLQEAEAARVASRQAAIALGKKKKEQLICANCRRHFNKAGANDKTRWTWCETCWVHALCSGCNFKMAEHEKSCTLSQPELAFA